MLALLAVPAPGADVAAREPAVVAGFEQQVKAALVYQVAGFVEWPAEAFPGPASSLGICVLGDDALQRALAGIVRDRKVRDRPLAARRVRDVGEAKGCQILFTARSQAERLPEILAALRGAPVLTVGEGEDFARLGGIIGFIPVSDRIGFEINLSAAARARLIISPELLVRAAAVRTEPEPPR